MADDQHRVFAALAKAQYDLTSAQAWIAEVRRLLASLQLPEMVSSRCEHTGCGLAFPGPLKLGEHVYLTHDGPVPPHWERAEDLAVEPEPVPVDA